MQTYEAPDFSGLHKNNNSAFPSKYLPPLGKSSASISKGWGGRHLVINGVASPPVSHARAIQ